MVDDEQRCSIISNKDTFNWYKKVYMYCGKSFRWSNVPNALKEEYTGNKNIVQLYFISENKKELTETINFKETSDLTIIFESIIYEFTDHAIKLLTE